MKNYLSFLYVTLFKKKTIWITACIYWMFLAFCVIIIPPIFKYDYMFIWNNQILDIKPSAIIIVACFCSVLAVAIFRDPIDDGTELITISKPISRRKIMLSKFIVFVSFCLMLSIFSSFIIYFGSLYPFNDTADNVWVSASLVILGTLLIAILFGAISILISVFAEKVAIISFSIGISIILNVAHMIMPIISSAPVDYINSTYGLNTNSFVQYDSQGNKRGFVTVEDLSDGDSKTSLDYLKEGEAHDTMGITTSLDFAAQIESAFDLNIGNNANLTPYCFDDETKYKVNPNSNWEDAINARTYTPTFILPDMVVTHDGVRQLSYTINSLDPQNYLIQSLVSSNDAYAYLYKNSDWTLTQKIGWSNMNDINDPNFVNYIVDKYLWDYTPTEMPINSGIIDQFYPAGNKQIGFLKHNSNNAGSYYPQMFNRLLAQGDYENGGTYWESYDPSLNITDFETQTSPSVTPLHVNPDKDIAIVERHLNDKDLFNQPVVTGTAPAISYNVPYFLIKALGPYSWDVNRNNMPLIYSQAWMKLENIVAKRASEIFIDGVNNKHYFLDKTNDTQPDPSQPGYFKWDDPLTCVTNYITSDRNFLFNWINDLCDADSSSMVLFEKTIPGSWNISSYDGNYDTIKGAEWQHKINHSVVRSSDVLHTAQDAGNNGIGGLYEFTNTPYINRIVATVVWTTVSVSLFFGVAIIYTKTDFK